jgi:hypothetical protein
VLERAGMTTSKKEKPANVAGFALSDCFRDDAYIALLQSLPGHST